MMTPKQTDCAACEQALLEAEDLEALAGAGVMRDHLAQCAQCAELCESLKEVKPSLDRYRVPEPAPQLVDSVILAARRLQMQSPAADSLSELRPTRLFRVVLASLAALPLVVLIDAALGWALFACATRIFPRSFAFYCVGLFVAWVSLGVSLSYASLPFLSLLAARPPDPAGRR